MPLNSKIFFVAAGIGYFVLPFDIIMDWIPGLGFLDDIGVVLFLMERFINSAPGEIVAEYTRK